MGGLVEYDASFDPQISQTTVEFPESILGLIPTPALVYGYVDILSPEVFHQVKHCLVPIAPQDPGVVPVDACNEDPLISHIRNGLLTYELTRGRGEDGEEIDQAYDGQDED